jgi:hypothetical protein
MQGVTVATLQDHRVQEYRIPSPPSVKCKVLRESLSVDPSIFIFDLQDANKKLIKKMFFCVLLFERTFTSFSKIKSQKEVTKQ